MDATYIGNSLSTPNPPDMKNGAFGAGFPLRGHYGALRKAGLRSRNLKWSLSPSKSLYKWPPRLGPLGSERLGPKITLTSRLRY